MSSEILYNRLSLEVFDINDTNAYSKLKFQLIYRFKFLENKLYLHSTKSNLENESFHFLELKDKVFTDFINDAIVVNLKGNHCEYFLDEQWSNLLNILRKIETTLAMSSINPNDLSFIFKSETYDNIVMQIKIKKSRLF